MLSRIKILKRIIFSIIILFLSSAFANAQNENSGLDEFWQELFVYRQFSEKVRGELLFNNLYSSQLGNYDWFLEGKIAYSVLHWLDVELLYRHEFYDFNGTKVQEYRPMFRVSGKTKIGNWDFKNRHRLEYRMFEIGESQLRYRTDLKIKPNWNWTSLNLNPYVNEEIFFAREKMSRNRIYGGFEAKAGRFEPAVYFLIQSDNLNSDWMHRNIVGVVLGIEL